MIYPPKGFLPCYLTAAHIHSLSLGQLYLLLTASPSRYFTVLMSLNSWTLHCIFALTLTALHIALSGANCFKFSPHHPFCGLLGLPLKVGGTLHEPITLASACLQNCHRDDDKVWHQFEQYLGFLGSWL